jgi:hypothetical protein
LVVVFWSPALRADDAAGEALVRDISRIVGSEEGSGWFVDARALEEVYPAVMESLCRATPNAREHARALLTAEVKQHGDARKLFEASGHELTSAMEDARRKQRELAAFEYAAARAETECPYWVEIEEQFRGRQGDADRFTLSLETGGLVQLRQTADTWTFGGGGYGRLLPGYGFGGEVTLLFGPEFGGGAMIRPGTSPTEFVINYFPAVPVVMRFHDGSWQYDLEMAAVGLFQADDPSLSYGARIGGSVGVKGLRTRNILPWAGLALAYEHYVASGGRPRAHFLRGGLRVGLMWDP